MGLPNEPLGLNVHIRFIFSSHNLKKGHINVVLKHVIPIATVTVH